MPFQRFPETLDPDAPLGKDFTFPFSLTIAGDALTSAVIDIVDSTSTNVIVGSLTTISEVTFGLISGALWGVTFRAQGGAAGRLYLRCRYETALGNGDDRTCWLLIEQR